MNPMASKTVSASRPLFFLIVQPEVVVVGAGPSGLAVARELAHRHGISTLVVEKAAAPAVSWRTRYDNFRLNTNGFLSHLPGQRIPLTARRWPTQEDMVRYFDSYVRRQNIAVALNCEVTSIDRGRQGWRLATSTGELCPAAVVLATGRYRRQTVPPWHGLSHFTGEVVHSGDYRNAWPFQGRDVLVVGAGIQPPTSPYNWPPAAPVKSGWRCVHRRTW